MNYAEPLSNQVMVFIRGVGFGVLLGLLYEAFTVLRNLISDKKWAYVLCDISFSLIAAVMSFFFMILFNGGIVRLNLILAQLLGGVALHLSAGRHLIKPMLFVGGAIRKGIRFVFSPVRFILHKGRALLSTQIKKLKSEKKNDSVPKKDRKKIKNIIKIPLKK